jgi:hypothetical protein
MIGAHSYDTVCRQLAFAFRQRYPNTGSNKVRMVGFVFARPNSPLAKSEIIDSLDYFHHRSGRNIDFFCGGYGMYWEPYLDKVPDQQVVATVGGQNWLFSAEMFNRFRQEVENRTSWKYGGGVDLLLANGRYDAQTENGTVDFTSSIAMNLDKAKEEKAILSVEQFFEEIFRYAEEQSGDDPTWGFSDRMGAQLAGSAFKSLILYLLPKSIREDARKAFHFYVRDIAAAAA